MYLPMAYIQPVILNEYLQRQMAYDDSELPFPLLVWIQLQQRTKNYTGKYAGLLAHRLNQVNNINTEQEFLLRLN
jgi:hypothetical protein